MLRLRWSALVGLPLLFGGVAPSVKAAISVSPPLTAEPQLASSQLLERGRSLYQSGRFAEAAEAWSAATDEYGDRGDRLYQAWSASYLSLAYQNLGQWEQARVAIDRSTELLESEPLETAEEYAVLARALNARGSLELAMGHAQAALEAWEEAERAYTAAGDDVGRLGSQINQAQAYQTLGLYRRATVTLEAANAELQNQSDSLLKAYGLRSLGVALQVVGDLGRSEAALKQSLSIGEQLQATEEIAATLFALGNTARDANDSDRAIEYYERAATTAVNPMTALNSRLNQMGTAIDTGQESAARSLVPEVETLLSGLSPSRPAIYAQVNFAQSLMDLSDTDSSRTGRLLATAVNQARTIEDPRAEAHALGTLGQLYERQGRKAEALDLTEQALQLAASINATDIAAGLHWQAGRILKQQQKVEPAIAAYSQAVDNLSSLRGDLVAVNPDVQFSFRKSVEPVYRELVSLLLTNPTQDNLRQARETIESLQLAELDNFFREACLEAEPTRIDEVDDGAAVIYPIILDDRLATIVSIGGGPLQHYETQIDRETLETRLRRARALLNLAASNAERLELYQEIYGWLIAPIEADLAANNTETLVFVLDGVLRNVPMSALHDGENYLIEKYGVALTPGLQLLASKQLETHELKAVAAGISEARQGFVALPGVEKEVKEIAEKMSARVLLDSEFTSESLMRLIQSTPYPVLHLATHGQFSSDIEDTFVLTWDGKINLEQLNNLLQSRDELRSGAIELLVLSACQTARGDDRAVLGLAGLAVRSGARSTMATLWAVRDESTAQLMSEFYQQLGQPEATKAEALRQAQLNLIADPNFNHPYYWAPFVLVGNWL